ncbi:hypothetical protein V8J88_15370 [Massilia sp. W12]|uniref:hypothetical protein n=1 Tax=Massilia sp. W12 TaxID=3126507 RepID=UPI0030D32ED5
MPSPRPLFSCLSILAVSVAMAACSRYGKEIPPGQLQAARGFAAAQSAGVLQDSALNEISGCAASRRQPGLLWLHNDSGDSARIFAVNHKGVLQKTYTLEGVKANDFEDIAIGPGPQAGEHYLYLGDIGDNWGWRRSAQVYRMAEPDSAQPGASLRPESFTIHYPGGALDAETLMLDPANGDLYIVSKRETPNRVFRFRAPLRDGGVYTGEEVGQVNIDWLTGGDISADGAQILLRTVRHIYLWQRAPGESIAAALQRAPLQAPAGKEHQGEAVCWAANGRDYYSLSEGKQQHLYFYRHTGP